MSNTDTIKIGNLTACLIQDIHPENPREDYDHLGRMACWHRRYNLGDPHRFEYQADFLAYLVHEALTPDERDRRDRIQDLLDRIPGNYVNHTWEPKVIYRVRHAWLTSQLDALKEQALTKYVILPLYLMDHSGLAISTKPFSCPWDSGQVGWIYMTLDEARENWPDDPDPIESAERRLRAEVEEYNAYLSGDVWGYTITDEDGNEIDSCWGFYGLEYAQESAESAARALADTLPIQLETSL